MSPKTLSHLMLAALVAFTVAGPVPAIAFGVSVDPLPTLTFPPKPGSDHSSRACGAAASSCSPSSKR